MNIEQQFRVAASNGYTDEMRKLYNTNSITSSGPTSGKTAAHWAAEKGHASALRLLHSLGDTFTQLDNKGRTPEQLATNRECIQVFKLAKLGKKAIEAAMRVFPQTLDVENLPASEDQKFQRFRDEVNKLALQRLITLPFNKDEISTVSALLYNLYTLDVARKRGQLAGACGEQTVASYCYLTRIAKTDVLVEEFDEGKGEHAFLVLNRRNDSYKEALIVDPLTRKCDFYENKTTDFTRCTIAYSNASPQYPQLETEVEQKFEELWKIRGGRVVAFSLT